MTFLKTSAFFLFSCCFVLGFYLCFDGRNVSCCLKDCWLMFPECTILQPCIFWDLFTWISMRTSISSCLRLACPKCWLWDERCSVRGSSGRGFQDALGKWGSEKTKWRRARKGLTHQVTAVSNCGSIPLGPLWGSVDHPSGLSTQEVKKLGSCPQHLLSLARGCYQSH